MTDKLVRLDTLRVHLGLASHDGGKECAELLRKVALESLLLLLHGDRRHVLEVDLVPLVKRLVALEDVECLAKSAEVLAVSLHAPPTERCNLVRCTRLLVEAATLGRRPLTCK